MPEKLAGVKDPFLVAKLRWSCQYHYFIILGAALKTPVLKIRDLSPELLPAGTQVLYDIPLSDFKLPDVSIYEQLYGWLMKNHGMPDDHSIHNRAYAGKSLAKELRRLEAKRIQKRNPGMLWKEAKLKASWNDLGSGPKEGIGNIVEFEDVALFVIPRELRFDHGWQGALIALYMPKPKTRRATRLEYYGSV